MSIRSIIVSHLREERVRDVHVSEDVNSDGEKLLRISVVYEAGPEGLPLDKMTAISDEIWDCMVIEGKGFFPIISFVASEDAGDIQAAE